MAEELSIFDDNFIQAPAHIATAFDGECNIERRATVPSLSYAGKVWTVSVDGEKQRLTRVNAEGDEEPLSVMRVIVLDAAKNRGRAYYATAYDPDSISTPTCWSNDGKHPDESIPEPQGHTCAECPMSAKGSKITEQGKSVAACSQHRLLAVVPAGKPSSTPLRLKIAVTSDYDKQSPDEQAKGWFAFSNYMDFLLSRGIQHTAQVITKVKFDQTVAYPKLFFSPDRWLTADELNMVKPRLGTPEITSLLVSSFDTPGATSAATTDEQPDEQPASKPSVKPASKSAAKPASKSAAKPASKSAAKPASKSAAKPSAAAQDATAEHMQAPVDDPDESLSMSVPDDVAALLSEWGDDDD